MKKVFAALFVLVLGMPVLADVAITASDAGNQQLLISFNSTTANAVRGVALTVTVTGGTITSASNFLTSDFNTFTDYAFTAGAGYTIGTGHPFALETAPGVATFPIASGTPFALSVGYLDMAGTKLGLTSGVIAKIQIDGIAACGSATVAISANAARGGAVVGENLGTVTVQPPVCITGAPCCYTLIISPTPGGIIEPVEGCYAPGTVVSICATPDTYYKFAGWTGDTANIADPSVACTTITMNADAMIAATFVKRVCRDMFTGAKLTNYDAYVAAGKDPSCWCWKYQCRGDADNATSGAPYNYRIYTGDLNCITQNWKRKPGTGANPCCDCDHINSGAPYYYQIYTSDLNCIITNWKKKDNQLTICPEYIAP